MKKRTVYDSDIITLFAYIALVLSGLLYLLNWLFVDIIKGDLGVVAQWMTFIRDIAFVVGVGLAAFKFTYGKGIAIKVIFWVAVISYVVFAVLNVL